MNNDLTKQNQEKFLEELLDRGLAQYAAVEPRQGLESRILTAVQAEQQPAPASSWLFASWVSPQLRWAGALALSVVIAVVAWTLRPGSSGNNAGNPAHNPTTAANTANPPTAQPSLGTQNISNTSPVRAVTSPAVQHSSQPVEIAQQQAARLATFPSPSPLTEQEKLMLAYLKHTDRNEVLAQSHLDPPLDGFTGSGAVPDNNRFPDESRLGRPASVTENVKR